MFFDSNNGKIVMAAESMKGNINPKHNLDKVSKFPSMPCVCQDDHDHRSKIGGVGSLGFNAALSRPVGRGEMMKDPEAFASMQKEWKGRRQAGVYNFSIVRVGKRFT